MEYDGVVVEDTSDLQRKAWLKVAELENKSLPPVFLLKRAEGMKNDQVMPPPSPVQIHTSWYCLTFKHH